LAHKIYFNLNLKFVLLTFSQLFSAGSRVLFSFLVIKQFQSHTWGVCDVPEETESIGKGKIIELCSCIWNETALQKFWNFFQIFQPTKRSQLYNI